MKHFEKEMLIEPFLKEIYSIYNFYKELDMRELKEDVIKSLKIVESDYQNLVKILN